MACLISAGGLFRRSVHNIMRIDTRDYSEAFEGQPIRIVGDQRAFLRAIRPCRFLAGFSPLNQGPNSSELILMTGLP
jgi:hypothetical protein